jgi:hypothetical protein
MQLVTQLRTHSCMQNCSIRIVPELHSLMPLVALPLLLLSYGYQGDAEFLEHVQSSMNNEHSLCHPPTPTLRELQRLHYTGSPLCVGRVHNETWQLPKLRPKMPPIRVFITFEKCASNTLYQAFAARARRLQLPTLSVTCEVNAQSRLRRHYHESTWCYNDKMPPGCCASEGARGMLVHDRRVGFCESGLLKGSHGGCAYLTVLREPLSRAVSAYNFFCVRCMEGWCSGGRQGKCPNQSLVQFARQFRDSHGYAPALGHQGLEGHSSGAHGHRGRRAVLQLAQARLAQMYTLTLEALVDSNRQNVLLAAFEQALGDPPGTLTNSKAVRALLRSGLGVTARIEPQHFGEGSSPDGTLLTLESLGHGELRQLRELLHDELALYTQAREQQEQQTVQDWDEPQAQPGAGRDHDSHGQKQDLSLGSMISLYLNLSF